VVGELHFLDLARRKLMMTKASPLIFIVLAAALAFSLATPQRGCSQEDATESFRLFPVGKVEKLSGATTIKIYKEYEDALLGLDQFSHVIVLYWFDRNDTPAKRKTLRVYPRRNKNNPLTGVFATRSPLRPNLIGLSVCKIQSIENNVIHIDSIDAFHDSPVLDLKPYAPALDWVQNPRGPKWVK
jgi:tRNA-Thr(GGU) m(6)t(6)A37 methyltransferase TsaA